MAEQIFTDATTRTNDRRIIHNEVILRKPMVKTSSTTQEPETSLCHPKETGSANATARATHEKIIHFWCPDLLCSKYFIGL